MNQFIEEDEKYQPAVQKHDISHQIGRWSCIQAFIAFNGR